MPKKLAIGGCIAVMVILSIVLLVNPAMDNPYSFSNRLCPSGYYSAMYSSLPMYRGGPAEQFSVKCIPKGTPVYAEHMPFVRNNRPNFDRIRQDPYAMVYYG